MPINQEEIGKMLSQCIDAKNVGRKVYFCERGNLMTAINYFQKITGSSFDLGIPSATDSSGSTGSVARTATFSSPFGAIKAFQFNSYTDQVGGTKVTVTLRGGSSSPVKTERYVLTSGDDRGLTYYTEDLPGVPTMEFQNASALTAVQEFQGIGDRIVEIKFTTRSEFVSAKDYYVSH